MLDNVGQRWVKFSNVEWSNFGDFNFFSSSALAYVGSCYIWSVLVYIALKILIHLNITFSIPIYRSWLADFKAVCKITLSLLELEILEFIFW